MTRTLSQKFRFFTFICIALLVYVHGYNLQDTYLSPVSSVKEPLTFTTFFEYLFANGLLRFRIPVLFIISGYLYAYYDHRPYLQQVKHRIHSLLLPFLLWSALALLFTFLLQQIPFTARVVYNTGLDQLGDNRPYTAIGWGGITIRWLLAPIAYQLWFIAVLFVFNLAYPLLCRLTMKLPAIWLPFTYLLFFFAAPSLPFLDLKWLFFFCAGIWIQKKNFSIEEEPRWFSLGLSLIAFTGLSIIKTFMAFELEPDTFSTFITLLILHQAAITAGILAMWFAAGRVIPWFTEKKWYRHASRYSFFIFCAHVPLLPYLMQWCLSVTGFLPMQRLVLYIVVPLAVLVFSVWLGSVLQRLAPGIYRRLTGGRGF